MKQIKLEVGKTYRSREGKEVRIIEKRVVGEYPYQFKGSNGEWYAESGRFDYYEEVDIDLIEEAPTETRHTFAIPDGVKEITLLLIAFFSILFYWIGEALTERAEWLIWRVKLQMKRCKEKRRKRRNSSKFDGAYLDSLIQKSRGNWKDIDADEWVNDLRGKS